MASKQTDMQLDYEQAYDELHTLVRDMIMQCVQFDTDKRDIVLLLNEFFDRACDFIRNTTLQCDSYPDNFQGCRMMFIEFINSAIQCHYATLKDKFTLIKSPKTKINLEEFDSTKKKVVKMDIILNCSKVQNCLCNIKAKEASIG